LSAIEKITAFVEGVMSVPEFEKQISENREIIDLLTKYETLPKYITENNLYQYIIEKKLDSIENIYNIQNELSGLLNSKNIKHKVDDTNAKLLDIMLKVQPSWLDIPYVYFSELITEAGTLKNRELQVWLKEKIKLKFISLNKPPKWLQTAQWPIVNNTPLIFVGQLDISKIRHDDSQVYVFFNEKENSFLNIIQSA
jgi:hypothetical protein